MIQTQLAVIQTQLALIPESSLNPTPSLQLCLRITYPQ